MWKIGRGVIVIIFRRWLDANRLSTPCAAPRARRPRAGHPSSQDRTADLAGGVGSPHRSEIDRAYMSSIERGQQNPGFVSVARISQALDMTLAELMQEAGL
jgi:transcriptional regulator with XRE-family HTH domain